MAFDTKYENAHEKRFARSLLFLEAHVPAPAHVLDIGPVNIMTERMTNAGYSVVNTPEGVDLDLDPEIVCDVEADVTTAFEIFEHMVNPFTLLRNIRSMQLVASVPLRLWFSTAYWNPKDPMDRHYHEFEPRQFRMLLEKAGWKIQDSDQWATYGAGLGIRPLLRRFTPRHMIVFCRRM